MNEVLDKNAPKKLEFSSVLIGQIVNILGGVITLSFISNRLSVTNLALYAVIMTAVAGISQVGFGGLNAATSRFFSIASSQSKGINFFEEINKLTFFYSIRVVTFIAPVAILLAVYNDTITLLCSFFVVLSSAFSSYRNNLIRIQNAYRQRVHIAVYQVLEITLKLIGLYFFLSDKHSLEVVFAISFFATFIVLFIQFHQLKESLSNSSLETESEYKQTSNRIYEFMMPYYLWTAFVWLFQSSGRWSLSIFDSELTVAGFMILYQLCFSPVAILFTALSTYLSPFIYGDYDSENHKYMFKLSRYKVCFLTLLLVLLYCGLAFIPIIKSLSEIYFGLVVPELYISFVIYLPLMVITAIFAGLGELMLLGLQSQLRVKEIQIIRSITSVLGIILVFIGSFYVGIMGVILGMLAASVINLGLFIYVYKIR